MTITLHFTTTQMKEKNKTKKNTLNWLRLFQLLNPWLQLELFNVLSFSQFAFSLTTLFYHKNFRIKTGQMKQLDLHITFTGQNTTCKEIHETYYIKEITEILHEKNIIWYFKILKFDSEIIRQLTMELDENNWLNNLIINPPQKQYT